MTKILLKNWRAAVLLACILGAVLYLCLPTPEYSVTAVSFGSPGQWCTAWHPLGDHPSRLRPGERPTLGACELPGEFAPSLGAVRIIGIVFRSNRGLLQTAVRRSGSPRMLLRRKARDATIWAKS